MICEACEVSLHPGVLICNGDEVQACSDCGKKDDYRATEVIRSLGLAVSVVCEEGRTAYVLRVQRGEGLFAAVDRSRSGFVEVVRKSCELEEGAVAGVPAPPSVPAAAPSSGSEATAFEEAMEALRRIGLTQAAGCTERARPENRTGWLVHCHVEIEGARSALRHLEKQGVSQATEALGDADEAWRLVANALDVEASGVGA